MSYNRRSSYWTRKENLNFSADLINFLNGYFEKATMVELSRNMGQTIKRHPQTILNDIRRHAVPREYADAYLDAFHDIGYSETGKPFMTDAEIVEVEKPVTVEVIVEKPVTAKGEDWDSLTLFKLVSQLSNQDFLYLQMLVGADTDWFYKMETDRLLKLKLITEEDIRKDPKDTSNKNTKRRNKK